MNQKHNRLGFATRSIHAGQQPDPSTGAIMTPIYATSTYVQESPGRHQGFEYSRTSNPTRLAYERCIADLESGAAVAYLGQPNVHPGVDRVIAVYPDGRAFAWHQMNDELDERGVMD